MLYQTTQEHEAFRQKMRGFAESEVKPIAFMLDQNNEFPAEAVKKLGEMGLMGIPYPKEYGGAGLDVLSYAIAVEELSRVDGGAGVILSAHVSLGSYPIMAFGTEEQKQKYLVPLAKGEKIGRLWSDRAKCRQRRRWYRDDSRIGRRPLCAQRR